jgi:hypothetical protein
MVSKQDNDLSSVDVPNARFDFRERAYQPRWILLTARCAGIANEAATIEMSLDDWIHLAPVQYVVKLELSQQQPRRPRALISNSSEALPVPRGHIEWKEGQNWVVITAYRVGTQEPVTVEMPLGQWLPLQPVRAAVRDGLDNWVYGQMPKW